MEQNDRWAAQTQSWRAAGWLVEIDANPMDAEYDEVCLDAPSVAVHALVSRVDDEVIMIVDHKRREMDLASFLAYTASPDTARSSAKRTWRSIWGGRSG